MTVVAFFVHAGLFWLIRGNEKRGFDQTDLSTRNIARFYGSQEGIPAVFTFVPQRTRGFIDWATLIAKGALYGIPAMVRTGKFLAVSCLLLRKLVKLTLYFCGASRWGYDLQREGQREATSEVFPYTNGNDKTEAPYTNGDDKHKTSRQSLSEEVHSQNDSGVGSSSRVRQHDKEKQPVETSSHFATQKQEAYQVDDDGDLISDDDARQVLKTLQTSELWEKFMSSTSLSDDQEKESQSVNVVKTVWQEIKKNDEEQRRKNEESNKNVAAKGLLKSILAKSLIEEEKTENSSKKDPNSDPTNHTEEATKESDTKTGATKDGNNKPTVWTILNSKGKTEKHGKTADSNKVTNELKQVVGNRFEDTWPIHCGDFPQLKEYLGDVGSGFRANMCGKRKQSRKCTKQRYSKISKLVGSDQADQENDGKSSEVV